MASKAVPRRPILVGRQRRDGSAQIAAGDALGGPGEKGERPADALGGAPGEEQSEGEHEGTPLQQPPATLVHGRENLAIRLADQHGPRDERQRRVRDDLSAAPRRQRHVCRVQLVPLLNLAQDVETLARHAGASRDTRHRDDPLGVDEVDGDCPARRPHPQQARPARVVQRACAGDDRRELTCGIANGHEEDVCPPATYVASGRDRRPSQPRRQRSLGHRADRAGIGLHVHTVGRHDGSIEAREHDQIEHAGPQPGSVERLRLRLRVRVRRCEAWRCADGRQRLEGVAHGLLRLLRGGPRERAASGQQLLHQPVEARDRDPAEHRNRQDRTHADEDHHARADAEGAARLNGRRGHVREITHRWSRRARALPRRPFARAPADARAPSACG